MATTASSSSSGLPRRAPIPAYTLTPQASSSFLRDASGQPVRLDGSAGIRAVLRNTTEGSGAPTDLKPALPAIREVANIGDFERVTSYGSRPLERPPASGPWS